MKEETRQQYISQANHFIQSRLETNNPHVQGLRQALIDHAFDDDPPGQNSWNKKRRALEEYYIDRCITDEAKFIKSTKFPEGAIKKKPGTCMKSVSSEDLQKLLAGCMAKRKPDVTLVGALTVLWLTGCRPSEMMTIELLPDNGIFIKGSKQTEDGIRGMDRQLYFDDKSFKIFSRAYIYMKKELEKLGQDQTEMDAVSCLQKRLARLNKKLFPRRKKHITFKSFRHQMGSDLKGSGQPRVTCAAILGHQSVNSINTYGDSRSGHIRVLPKTDKATINNVRVREVKNADFKETLVKKHGRKPDKKSPSKSEHQKDKIGGSSAYIL